MGRPREDSLRRCRYGGYTSKYRTKAQNGNNQKSMNPKSQLDNEIITVEDGSTEIIAVEDNPTEIIALEDGRRLITINCWLESLNIASNHAKTCSKADFVFEKELRRGLKSKFQLRCRSCCFSQRVVADKETNEVTIPVNEALVRGVNAGGSNFEATREIFTLLDVPFVNHPFYFKKEQAVIKKFEEALDHQMNENGKEEAELANANGDTVVVCGKEYPSIAVYVDGGWCTRSYGHSCKSKGGLAAIIGARTKKLLHIGIRNMFCAVCKRASNLEVVPKQHVCFKNWDESVSATNMETRILLEGFKSSIDTHGLVYNLMIADGDPSAYSTLLDIFVYHGVQIQKAECCNHVLKNLTKALASLTTVTNFPLQDRRQLDEAHRERMCKSVRSAIKYRHDQKDSHLLLRKDILNVPFHTFGQHDNCDPYFCKKSVEANLVLELKNTLLWKEILAVIERIANKSARLIYHLTTNIAESLMSKVAKHNLGKRINVIQRHGWHGKILTAGLSFTKGRAFYKSVYTFLTRCSTSKLWIRSEQNAAKIKERVKKYDPIRKLKRIRQKILRRPVSDFHYDPHASEPDIDEKAMNRRSSQFMTTITVDDKNRTVIFRLTTAQAGSDKWMEERRHRITASVAGDVATLKDSTPNTVLVRKILYAKNLGHIEAIKHGRAYEQQALKAYAKEKHRKWEESGLFVSLEHGCLAASPDAIVSVDGLVEVKCPLRMIGYPPEKMPEIMKGSSYLVAKSSSVPTLQLKRSHKYYKQVVMQIFVTGRQWCDFVVYSFPNATDEADEFKPFIETIERNAETTAFWEVMKSKPIRFFEQDLMPEIVDPRLPRGMPIRQPQYRQGAMILMKSKS